MEEKRIVKQPRLDEASEALEIALRMVSERTKEPVEALELKIRLARKFVKAAELGAEVTDLDVAKALIYATHIGADVLAGEVMIFGGNPRPTIKYWQRKLRERYPEANVFVRPMTPEEKELWGLDHKTFGALASVTLPDPERETVIEYEHGGKKRTVRIPGRPLALEIPGFASLDQSSPRVRGSFVEKTHPQEMAVKRAMEDAIAYALGYGKPPEFPSRGEVVHEDIEFQG